MNKNNIKIYDDSNWREEYKSFTNNKWNLKLLNDGPKQFSDALLLGNLYQRWKKIKGFDKLDPVVKQNKGQLQSSLKDFFKNT